jgi:hypothetical protein
MLPVIKGALSLLYMYDLLLNKNSQTHFKLVKKTWEPYQWKSSFIYGFLIFMSLARCIFCEEKMLSELLI